ncbi:hypothetical protein D3C75_1066660 [compost metagenome]
MLLQINRCRVRADLRLDDKTFLLKNLTEKLQDQRVVLNHQNQPARKIPTRRRYSTHDRAAP